MKIIDESRNKTYHYDALSIGEVFIFNGGGVDEYYMAIDGVQDFNAVDLWTGELVHFEAVDEICKVAATLTVQRV